MPKKPSRNSIISVFSTVSKESSVTSEKSLQLIFLSVSSGKPYMNWSASQGLNLISNVLLPGSRTYSFLWVSCPQKLTRGKATLLPLMISYTGLPNWIPTMRELSGSITVSNGWSVLFSTCMIFKAFTAWDILARPYLKIMFIG